MIDELRTLLESYEKERPEEGETVALFRSFLGRFSGLTPEQATGHVTGSAWVVSFDRSLVLLTHHAGLGKWFQPGGHLEPREGSAEGALREVREETGLDRLLLPSREIFDIDAHRIPPSAKAPTHWHFDVRFLVLADPLEPLIRTGESKELRWVTPGEARSLNPSASLSRMIAKTAGLPPSVFGEIKSEVEYHPRQGAYGLVVNPRDELALVRLPDGSFFLPGGGIEGEESPGECVEREFREETGLRVKARDYLGTSVQYVLARSHNRHYKIIGHMFLCVLTGRSGPRTEEDHELVWVPLEKASGVLAMENQSWAVNRLMFRRKS